jgi:hypothetical protein
MPDTQDLVFYHGTSSWAARSILLHGGDSKFFERIGAFELGRQIHAALLEWAGVNQAESWKMFSALQGPGSELSSLWWPALGRLVAPQEGRSLFEYGCFFVTLNLANAYRYAVNNPYRSEFLQVLAESLRFLKYHNHWLSREWMSRFPEVAKRLKSCGDPVVLEIRNITKNQLLGEDGHQDVDSLVSLHLEMQAFEGVNCPSAFRLSGLTPNQIAAVHDLRDWEVGSVPPPIWQPTDEQVRAASITKSRWLETVTEVG